MTDMNQPNNSSAGMFAHDIATDLASGRAVELAELYALDAVSPAERAAIEEYLSAAPGPERNAFDERVRQARETLAATFTAEEEPPAGLFDRILALHGPRLSHATVAVETGDWVGREALPADARRAAVELQRLGAAKRSSGS